MGLHFETSIATCQYVREQTDDIILAFSNGKDSIGARIQLGRYWPKERIHMVYRYTVPGPDGRGGLEFIERQLAYYEQVFDQPIYRVPHPQTIRMLHYKVFQSPDRLPAIDYLINTGVLPVLADKEMDDIVRACKGMGDAWFATGIRRNDSIQRRRVVLGQGSAHPNLMSFYPVWDWSIDELLGEIRNAGIKLTSDYVWFGRSLDGINMREVMAIKRYAPDDYQTLLTWFPLAELNVMLYEWRAKMLGLPEAPVPPLWREYERKRGLVV